MNAQPADTDTRHTAYAVRFVLWLLAAFSLAELAPAVADPLRTARAALNPAMSDTRVAVAPLTKETAAVASCSPVSETELPKPEPALDADDGVVAIRLPLPKGPVLGPETFGSSRLDGQAFAAFHSRAPPAA